ncbi:hybrid sensor histidine kinase/response regulator [Polymorphobacter glacialis]|uniref:histidine kinase n=1 Tax=Sandarakinorhabdus glacialis TaxID=1614636 RepID=A0A916ZPY6_9SPHN|nr:ATP-binding protein [Polymorphobacter glacialis]GGE07299.1 hybrid sensor histidine kinase/response regulator [Polymorphobacter glacialis]
MTTARASVRAGRLQGTRQYNVWAGDPTLEDYALRYTPDSARRWSMARIGNTAFGAASFLACEAIGATITLAYGFSNAIAAIIAAMVLLFAIGLPIAYRSARSGLDIDLLTRGAGFGYIGSTITSLIYASFTFLLFAIEASILSMALQLAFGINLAVAHVISSLIVIPIALYGMAAITRMQAWTQPVWLVLQLAPIIWILFYAPAALTQWSLFPGRLGALDGSTDLLLFGLALSTLLSLLPQIGEQADYLRFLPKRMKGNGTSWWSALLAGGPGWVIIGGIKLSLGSFLALYAMGHGLDAVAAASPPDMFLVVFREMTHSPGLAMLLTFILVLAAQMKINVTNAYAGSIAWSNFFSRLTHAHPGRVVWLVFNVVLALLLMEIGIFRVIEGILILYANLAAGWIGALAADLTISKPVGLSPRSIEFKRARLYDINPVGVGAMLLSIIVSTAAVVGAFGPLAHAFAPVLGLAIAFIAAPAIALATRGRYYLARDADLPAGDEALTCAVCSNAFERPDMAFCPAHRGNICSLCCTLEARCHDMCKDRSSFGEQATDLLERILPTPAARMVDTQLGRFLGALALFTLANGTVLYFIFIQSVAVEPQARDTIATTLSVVFFALAILSGIAASLLVLAHDSRRAAEKQTEQQTGMLMDEITAHTRTDAALKKARDAAEAANLAKSRYLVGVSHEIRSPLNAIYGYAQLLERGSESGPVIGPVEAGRVIRRSSEHLTNIVDGLLDISRIESGVLKLNRDTVPLPEFLDAIAAMFRMQAQEKGLDFHYEAPANLPAYVRTDEKRLRQILINLLSNAIKYTPAGHAALKIRYRGLIAEFEISDTGIGITPADIDRIFEPFERGSSEAAHAQPGTGLGLAITRVLAQVMGGDVTVTSAGEAGQGSVFRLRLMLAEPHDAPPATARQRQISGYAGPRRTILIIDDDPAQLAVLQGLLRPLGFSVYAASSGAAGIDLALRSQPDLVLLDIQMPGMSGWDVAKRLRAIDEERLRAIDEERLRAGDDERLKTASANPVKILFVSANAHEFATGGDGGAAHDGFVLKPVELESLLDAIAARLGLTWESGDSAAAAAPPPASLSRAALRGAAANLAELRRLGQVGHVRGIETGLDTLATSFPASQPLVDQLRSHVRAFDLKSYLKLLETHG